jgi:hypothetical protein
LKIALFSVSNFFAGSYSLGGYRDALTKMGHEVTNVSLPGNEVHNVEAIREASPTVEELDQHEVVLSMYHEYTQPWLDAIYGLEAWSKLKVPVIARFDESFDRADLGLPERWKELQKWAQHFSFPAHQDAKRFGGEFLPYGADVTKFFAKQAGSYDVCDRCDQMTNVLGDQPKPYDIGFIGTMYPLRGSYLQGLAPNLPDSLTFKYGQCVVQDLSGIRSDESTALLAENYRQLKIFFCLPPMSRLLVAKVFEVMACGTFVMFPKLPGDCRRNNEVFEDGKHIAYYSDGRMTDNAKQIMHYLEHEDEREAIARAGCEFVHKNHTLEGMLEKLLAPVRSREAVSQ